MELIADGLLIATAMTAGLYCLILSRKLGRLTESGRGIGSQIDALDQALSATCTALTEARDSASEVRNSAKAAAANLNRETGRSEETARRIERSVAEAKATMQRLYELNHRIEAYENEQPNVCPASAGAGADMTMIEVRPDEHYPSAARDDDQNDERGAAADSAGPTSTSGRRVILPEGNIETSGEFKPATHGTAGERTGSVLKAERVML